MLHSCYTLPCVLCGKRMAVERMTVTVAHTACTEGMDSSEVHDIMCRWAVTEARRREQITWRTAHAARP